MNYIKDREEASKKERYERRDLMLLYITIKLQNNEFTEISLIFHLKVKKKIAF